MRPGRASSLFGDREYQTFPTQLGRLSNRYAATVAGRLVGQQAEKRQLIVNGLGVSGARTPGKPSIGYRHSDFDESPSPPNGVLVHDAEA